MTEHSETYRGELLIVSLGSQLVGSGAKRRIVATRKWYGNFQVKDGSVAEYGESRDDDDEKWWSLEECVAAAKQAIDAVKGESK